jgi:hypothetical protein
MRMRHQQAASLQARNGHRACNQSNQSTNQPIMQTNHLHIS